MNVFQLRNRLVSDYSDFVRSYMAFRDSRIQEKVQAELNEGLLWPDLPQTVKTGIIAMVKATCAPSKHGGAT